MIALIQPHHPEHADCLNCAMDLFLQSMSDKVRNKSQVIDLKLCRDHPGTKQIFVSKLDGNANAATIATGSSAIDADQTLTAARQTLSASVERSTESNNGNSAGLCDAACAD
jgi:hypothetical protein